MRKISVIMPVYNAEKYVGQAIDSLLAQTFSDFELICVDDGSTDSSLGILRGYECVDSRVKVLTQQNQFAGVARNYGMSAGTGEYIMFLDSDDFFEGNMLDRAISEIERNQADVCVFAGWQYDDSAGERLPMPWMCNLRAVQGSKLIASETQPETIFQVTSPAPWNKVFRRGFIDDNQLLFQGIKNTNDVSFVLTALALAKKIVLVQDKLVHYRVNNSDSLQGKRGDEYPLCFEAYAQLKKNLIEHGKYQQVQVAFAERALSSFHHSFLAIQSRDCLARAMEYIKVEGFQHFDLHLVTRKNVRTTKLIDWLERVMTMDVDGFIISDKPELMSQVNLMENRERVDLKSKQTSRLRPMWSIIWCYQEHGLRYALHRVGIGMKKNLGR